MSFIKDSPAEIFPIHAEIHTAFNIKNALDRIRHLPQLGYCPTKVQQFRHKFGLDNDFEDDSDDSNDEYYTKRDEERLEIRFSYRDLANQVWKQVFQVCKAHVHPLTVSSIFAGHH